MNDKTQFAASLWSDEAWASAEHIYNEIIRLPFVRELAAGTLSDERFKRYIGQDRLYINVYCKVLAHIASRLPETGDMETFLEFASDGVAVEKALHGVYVQDNPPEMSPACLFYTSLLKAQAYEDVAVEAAAILPCFWIYQKVGEHIVATQAIGGNPYAEWIATYSDPSFEASTAKAIEICNRLAQASDSLTRDRMTQVFVECSRMEWLFWNSAYDDTQWPQAIQNH